MRKGGHLENEMDRVLKYLEQQGIHGHKNHAQKENDAFVKGRGEPFDYEVFSDTTFCFDTKECTTRTWNLKTNAKIKQINALKMCKNHGAVCFFLVYYVDLNKMVMFDVDLVIKAMADGIGGLSYEEGVEFDWRILMK